MNIRFDSQMVVMFALMVGGYFVGRIQAWVVHLYWKDCLGRRLATVVKVAHSHPGHAVAILSSIAHSLIVPNPKDRP